MTGSLSLNLILSLVFGVGQVVVGAWLAWHSLQGARHWRTALLVFVGLWFIVSGVIELFVSGMETSQRLTGFPAAGIFTLWRGRADTTLFVASAALALGAVFFALFALLAPRWQAVGRTGAADGRAAGTGDESVSDSSGVSREGEQGR